MRLTYNGVTLRRVMTTAWNETVEYDSTGMNMLGNKIQITVEGSVYSIKDLPLDEQDRYSVNADLSAFASTELGTAQGVEPLRKRLNLILRQLSMPCRSLVIYDDVDNEKIFQAYPIDDESQYLTPEEKRNVDINAGPKPRNVNVLHVYNNYARISVTFDVMKIRCLGGELEGLEPLGQDPTKGFIVSNRCWTEESLDSNFYRTRTFSGRLRISSPNVSVHFYRDLYYPPLEDGFRRESVRFSESEDGLTLSYSVTDKQTRTAAPYPATAFSGSVSYSVINGAEMRMNMQLTMIGRPDAPKDALTARCIQAVVQKIKEFSENNDGYQEKFNVSENLGDPPSVSVDVTYILVSRSKEAITSNEADKELAQLYASNVSLIGKPLHFEDLSDGVLLYTYERTKSTNPNPYGYNIYEVEDVEEKEESEENPEDGTQDKEEKTQSPARRFIKCIATVPCAVSAPQYAKGDPQSGEITGMGTKVIKDKDGAFEYTAAPSGVREESVTYPYSFYKSDITYYTDYARFVLPKANSIEDKTTTLTGEGDYTENFELELKENDTVVGSIKGQQQTVAPSMITLALTIIHTMEEETKTGTASLPVSGVTGTSISISITGDRASIKIEGEGSEFNATANISWESKKTTNNTRVVTLARPIPKAVVVIEAERFNRLPELPDPDEVVTTTGYDPIVFTCTNVQTKMCEPRPARNNDGVSYSVIAQYEFAMNRQYKHGDEIWLLDNPTFGSTCYYPKKLNETTGVKEDYVEALTTLYNGLQIKHEPKKNQEDNNPNGQQML